MTRIRNFFFFDLICALSGALLYFFLFDFIIEFTSLPPALVQTQLLANSLYALYGLGLFLSRTEKSLPYRALAFMNAVYASLCALAALGLLIKGISLGASLLALEGLLIAALAKIEFSLLRAP